ncbi:MAG: hypothetical protein QOJ23_3560 [Actinomycetota bacterium]|jgi:hypothetical protein|nr:hypothetical protein [Actinomycetota bacterium]
MRKLLTTLAGVTLALGLAAPAWADTAQKPADRPITASGDRGHSGGRGGARDSGRNRRGSDRTGYDRSRRDDRYGSYRDRYGDYSGYYYDRSDYGCGYGYGYGYSGCNDPYGYGYRSYADSGSERPTRFGSSSDDPLGDGRSHYDKLHHDDDSILF